MRPVLFSIFGLDVQTYGVSKVLAALLAAVLLARAFERLGLKKDDAYALVFWATVWGFVGAKIYFLLENLPKPYLAPSGRCRVHLVRRIPCRARRCPGDDPPQTPTHRNRRRRSRHPTDPGVRRWAGWVLVLRRWHVRQAHHVAVGYDRLGRDGSHGCASPSHPVV